MVPIYMAREMADGRRPAALVPRAYGPLAI